MDISGCSFRELSYSKLFNTYLAKFDQLKSFYPYNPLNEDDIKKRANKLKSVAYKDAYISALEEYHEVLGISESQKKQRDKLRDKNALTIVTGQQLGVFGGPLFTVYKAMTAIILAKSYEKKLNRPVIPVFWLADEDHDFEEIAWTGIIGRDDFHKIKLSQDGNDIPVSEEKITKAIDSFKEEAKEYLYETDFSENLWEQLNAHYTQGQTYAQAFAGIISEWFGAGELLVAGSNFKPIKDLLKAELKHSISNASQLYEAIEQISQELEEDFHRQVMNGDSNLFYLDKNGRNKIHKAGDKWTANKHSWSEDELLNEIHVKPEKFSPNVFLRPVIQDKLLPTLGYVAGPGEIAYYGQMKDFYKEFELEMPPIFPRYCGTIIESGISRVIEKLPFKICEYSKRIEDLESEFVEKADTTDLEKVFGEWKQKLEEVAEEPRKIINEIDPTLDGTVGKTVAGFSNDLDKLKGRVYRSIKKQEEIQLNRIEKIKINLFPDAGLQERAVSPIYFMNKYGVDIWKDLLEEIDKNGLDLSRHHLIEL